MLFSESERMCRTNISQQGNVVDSSDHVEIQCSVGYSGIWTPVFICAPQLPGISTNQTSSNHVQYNRTIAASDIEDSTRLNCSLIFTLTADYEDQSPVGLTSDRPMRPIYDLVWKTLTVRVADATRTYKGLSTLVSETGYFVSGNRILCCRKRQQSILFPDTKYPVSETSVDRPLVCCSYRKDSFSRSGIYFDCYKK